MKPGTSWVAMHELAERILARHLIDMGVLRGELDQAPRPVLRKTAHREAQRSTAPGGERDAGGAAQVVAAGLPAVFMPHGLGHNLGLETHDVVGAPPPPPPRTNRTRRVPHPVLIGTAASLTPY